MQRERLELPDGDFVDIAWRLQPERTNTNAPWVCIFHGLAGCLESAYASGLLAALDSAGFNIAFMHFRGCSGEPNRLAKTYHSGHTEDIRYLISEVQSRHPASPVHAVGFSLGGNALLKYLGEEKNQSPLTSAIAVSPPLVLATAAKRMNTGLSRAYQSYLVNLMRQHHERKRATYPDLNLRSAKGLQTFWQFDDAITAKLNGFIDVHDYYKQCSSRQYLQAITVNTHIIFSHDDPFFSPAVIPTNEELSAAVTLELTKRGGHVAFVTGNNPLKPQYWLDQRIPELLRESSVK